MQINGPKLGDRLTGFKLLLFDQFLDKIINRPFVFAIFYGFWRFSALITSR